MTTGQHFVELCQTVNDRGSELLAALTLNREAFDQTMAYMDAVEALVEANIELLEAVTGP